MKQVATCAALIALLGLFSVSVFLVLFLTTDGKQPSCEQARLVNTHAAPDRKGRFPVLVSRPSLALRVNPHTREGEEGEKQKTVFVSLPSYRDPEAPWTLLSAFTKADTPQRVFVGICQQNAPVDRDIVEEAREIARTELKDDDDVRQQFLGLLASNVRQARMASKHAKGHSQNEHRNQERPQAELKILGTKY